MDRSWEFIDELGSFALDGPQQSSGLYFPLANEAGMMSSITPVMKGDAKTGQNTFFLLPVSADDLDNGKSGRNFWFYIEGAGAWSAAGASSRQMAAQFSDDSGETMRLEAGFLWYKVTRQNARLGIWAEITSCVPAGGSRVELMRVEARNIGTKTMRLTPTAAIPIFGRSADNVRDHRHVTGLLNRIYTLPEGVELCPAMTFDERGHRPNAVSYCVFGADGEGSLPLGTLPVMEEFTGGGGSLEWPEAIVRNLRAPHSPGETIGGYEAVGALRFKDEELAPGQSKAWFIALSISDGNAEEKDEVMKYLSPGGFLKGLDETKSFWEEKLSSIRFHGADRDFSLWMKWVTLQPVLRRIYGCSFLPHHDYGRGGRGWRDLWQDCLALLLLEPECVRGQLLNHFGGVRLDGTNATIIGTAPGEFIADRNSISRVWSDHAAWPFFTTMLYIDSTGDFDFLLEQRPYFKDRLAMRAREADPEWSPEYGNKQKTPGGNVYMGTVLEHLLLQNAAAFFNAGRHNNIRLENADWNDALDMAPDLGETVAFTSFYAGNLAALAGLLREIHFHKGLERIELGEEICALFDTMDKTVDYNSPEEKRARLLGYCQSVRHNVSGKKSPCDVMRLAEDLERKAQWLAENIRNAERVASSEGYEWFNGYYDNAGEKVEGEKTAGVRMTLTGQVFPLMMGVATDAQAQKVAAAVMRYLHDEALGGIRLNTDFHEVKLDLGRCFGFAYGHKENGAIFSHMAVMYASALYRRGLAAEGHDVIRSLYSLSTDFEKAGIYPGIPEYFNSRGRGMYHYLTGSASWMLLVMLCDVYGVRGRFGDLVLDPKLMEEQFDASASASVQSVFAGRRLHVVYRNEERLGWGQYGIAGISIDGIPVGYRLEGGGAVLERACIEALTPGEQHSIVVTLSTQSQSRKGSSHVG
jgi:cellobiose phosphorylase